MPTVAGSVRLGTLSTFVYSHLAGSTRSVEDLTAGPAPLAREIGAALAAIHDLPRSLVSNADLPSYTPNEFRQRRLNELDQAATTGKIPSALLLRWEHAMEDVSLWRFNPCVVHGDLHEDNLLVEGQRVTAVTGWTDLRIGDPADDFAWLVASNEQDFVDAVLAGYTASRRDTPDAHLLRRAALSAEFALAQYLVKGIAAGDAEMVAEAEGMLETLAADIAEHGGQPISVEPQPPIQPGQTADVAPAGSGAGTASDTQSPEGQSHAGSSTQEALDGGPAAGMPAVTVVPVPVQPSVSAIPLPAQAAVHVTRIPEAPAAAAKGEGVPATEHGSDTASPADADQGAGRAGDDTSTAALSVIKTNPGQ